MIDGAGGFGCGPVPSDCGFVPVLYVDPNTGLSTSFSSKDEMERYKAYKEQEAKQIAKNMARPENRHLHLGPYVLLVWVKNHSDLKKTPDIPLSYKAEEVHLTGRKSRWWNQGKLDFTQNGMLCKLDRKLMDRDYETENPATNPQVHKDSKANQNDQHGMNQLWNEFDPSQLLEARVKDRYLIRWNREATLVEISELTSKKQRTQPQPDPAEGQFDERIR